MGLGADEYYDEYPVPDVAALDHWCSAAYAVACLERYVRLAGSLIVSIDKTSSMAIAQVAERLWADLELDQLAGDYGTLREWLESLIPAPSDYGNAAGSDFFERIVSIGLYAVEAASGNHQSAVYAGRAAYEFQDVVGARLLGLSELDEAAEEAILQTSCVRLEIAEQREDVRRLFLDVDEARSTSALRGRAQDCAVHIEGFVIAAMRDESDQA
jgi:hypothetical protein